MSRVLITTIGRVVKENNNRYRTTSYKFDNGEIYKTPFFGYALMQYLESTKKKLDKIIILGTATSMWDAWYEVSEALLTEENLEAAAVLNRKIESGLSSEDLSPLEAVLSANFNAKVVCQIIPYGETEAGQVEILSCIRNQISRDDNIVIDVTHGFRHLPMLELLSTFLLTHSSNIRMSGIYYGAFELKNPVTQESPAVRLDGLYNFNQWIEAVSVLETTGSVIKLSKLPEMAKISDDLLTYNFYDQTNDVGKAKKTAQKILRFIRIKSENNIVSLFRNNLERVFIWAESEKYYQRQFKQAKKAFDNGDYLRATILLFETYISFDMQKNNPKEKINQYSARTSVEQDILSKSEYIYFKRLKVLRNSLAHNTDPSKKNGVDIEEINEMRKDRKTFISVMEDVFKELGDKIKRYEHSLNEENKSE